jgi:hypothetical protein
MLGITHGTQSAPGTFAGNYYWFTVAHPEFCPHSLVDPLTREKHRFPILPDQPSKALRNLAGGVETNNRAGGVYQVEIVGMSEDFWAYPDWWYANLQEFLLEESAYAGVTFEFKRGNTRATFAEWDGPLDNIWYGHWFVPENDHWDPGTLDYDRLEATVITPQDAATIAAAVWSHPVKAVEDDLVTEFDHPASSVLGWDHKESKTTRFAVAQLGPAPAPGFNLQTVPNELLLAEVSRRFNL